MTKVLIVGATGLVGSSLVKACIAQNKEVRTLIRTESMTNPAGMKPLKAAGVDNGD
jgi:nucleoside-diphosphate-sugar epimerase